MAEKIDQDPFSPFLNGFTYDQAFDGNTWVLKRRQDFDQSPGTVARKIREEHDRRYGSLSVKDEGETVIVRRVDGKQP